MNENLNATGANNGTRDCDRAEQLVTYLYGEAAPAEAKAFRQHITSCAICRDEMAAFGDVRELVGEWRVDALGAVVPSLGMSESFATAVDTRNAPARRRSAIVALREFFSLSPLWLQAGGVAATLVVCALAALTIARAQVRWDANGFAINTGVKERVIEKERVVQVPVQTGLTQEQANAMIAGERAKWEEEKNRRGELIQTSGTRQRLAPHSANGTTPKRTAPGSTQRNQLARNDPEDFFSPNEERMPRLTDLLGAVNAPNKANER